MSQIEVSCCAYVFSLTNVSNTIILGCIIVIKPISTKLRYSWIIAVWTPVFTQFMHEYLRQYLFDKKEIKDRKKIVKEIFVGDVVQAAIDNNIIAETVSFENGSFLDIGTPNDLLKAINDMKK